MTALAKRAVAAGWRWMRGAKTIGGSLCVSEATPGISHSRATFVDLALPPREPFELRDGFGLPDLDDPATLGCLLAMVREAWGKPKLYVSPHGDGWRVKVKGPNPFDDCKWGDTEAGALVAALEAAPGPVMP